MVVADRAAVGELPIEVGRPRPWGATPDAGGVNFAVFADRATSVRLLLFDSPEAVAPARVIDLDPGRHRTFGTWHVYVPGLGPGAHYAYRVDGPGDLHQEGDRFNPKKVLIDPYARGNTDDLWQRRAACGPDDNLATSMRSVVIDASTYDWEGDRPLNLPPSETIIYEMHVRGFTRSPSSGVAHPGTFRGVVEKIPYLRELGITAVELLPVFDFDEKEVKQIAPDGTPLPNYWGYDPYGFFAPQSSYCVTPECGSHLDEFRDMVKALHRAGIEVILDVVFNHTSEGNQEGPTINFRGLGNGTYYLLSPQDQQWYMDFSGCGNTFDANHPVVEKLIGDCLDFWAGQMHVDGFRFDEASILTRDDHGQKMDYPPVVWHVELAETQADTKAIAEPWDAGSLYEVGDFPERWAAWNDRFRDTVRRFVRGDRGWFEGKTLVGRVADVISGSADVFAASDRIVSRRPANGVNFVTAHDGFTLNDLVSYDAKHNEANGEGNRDGNDNNLSWNCGVEGPSSDPAIEALRLRQVKNFAAILLLSQGVPMILMGDEVRRTQRGNNNAYCQDNETSWFDWTQVGANRGLLRFFQRMIAFRKRHPSVRRERFFDGTANERGLPDVTWHGCRLRQPGWSDPGSAVLAFTLGGFAGEPDLHVMLNMDGQDLDFDLPPIPGRGWFRVVDTSLASPDDVVDPGHEVEVTTGETYRVNARSVVVLMSEGLPAADANGPAAISAAAISGARISADMENTEWTRSTSPSRTRSPAT